MSEFINFLIKSLLLPKEPIVRNLYISNQQNEAKQLNDCTADEYNSFTQDIHNEQKVVILGMSVWEFIFFSVDT